MASVQIHIISGPGDPALAELPALFRAMYSGMEAQGLRTPLAPDGEQLWIEQAVAGAERFGRLVVAIINDVVIGFAHGAIKLAPEHLGGQRVGHITHLYVDPTNRRSGAGHALAHALNDWFASKDVVSVELQVVVGNAEGEHFWRSLGFVVEFHQMRKR